MYLAHFGFTHYPFERALQPDELFASSAAREAQARACITWSSCAASA